MTCALATLQTGGYLTFRECRIGRTGSARGITGVGTNLAQVAVFRLSCREHRGAKALCRQRTAGGLCGRKFWLPEFRYVHRSICAARVVGTYLPNGFIKAAQDLGALVPLPYLSLLQRETEFMPNSARKLCHPLQGVHQPDQPPRLVDLFRHNVHSMPELA